MPKARRRAVPKNAIPGFIAAQLTSGDQEATKQQIRDLGFRLWQRPSLRLWKAKAKVENTSITIQSPDLGRLWTLCSCVWTGLNE